MSECIKVALRIRPLVESEINRGCQPCVESVRTCPQVVVTGNRSFTFDYVFAPECTQIDVYEASTKALVKRLFKGYNVTVLAYGQTGSGKTHTMGTSYMGDGERGVIPRSVEDIFYHVQHNAEWDFKISVSFVELYKEQLYDLLSKERTIVDIREDTKGICIPGLTEITVTSTEETINCLQAGSKGRVTGATAMNKHSSRSHAAFILTIHQQKKDDPSSATSAKFYMVDLAGSERSKKTQAEGDRFKEGVTINAGLLALGNIIAALGEGSKQVPSYRNSKLTRILQDSLGGNALTLMIACISPADYNLEETMSTLRYANRAKQIKNKPVINQDPQSAEIAVLKAKVAELQLLAAGGQILPDEQQEEKIKTLEIRVRELTQELLDVQFEKVELAAKIITAENARENLKEQLELLKTQIENGIHEIEAGSEEKESCLEAFKKSFCVVVALQNEQKRCDDEERQEWKALQQDTVMSDVAKTGSLEDLQEHDLMLEKYNKAASTLSRQLNQLNKEMAITEQLKEEHEKNKVLIVETCEQSSMLKEHYEKQIDVLEKEKEQLMKSIKQLEAMNKETEAKVKQTELAKKNTQIESLQKKLSEQTKIVRQKDEAEKKAERLALDLKQMKQAKVKLIKQMKQESDEWKAWKIQKEKEALRLREQDRKRQNEILRLQALHSKQQNVSKRKLEEAISANKRLKEALSKQKIVRMQREARGNNHQAQIQEFVAHEMEVLVNTVDAERTLQLLLDHRAALSEEIAQLRRQTIDSTVSKRLKELAQEVEVRTAQITEYQQKILDSDQENKHKTRWEAVGSMADAKLALTHTMRLAADIRREALLRDAEHQEAVAQQQALKARIEELERDLSLQHEENQETILKLQKEHRQQVEAVVEISNKENNPLIQSKELALQKKEQENEMLQRTLNVVRQHLTPKRRHSRHNEYEDVDLTPGGPTDDESSDPTWHNTPIHQRLKILRHPSLSNTARMSEQFRCGCRTDCATKRCFCTKGQSKCTKDCTCDPKKCTYKLKQLKPLSEQNRTFVADTTEDTLKNIEESSLDTTFTLAETGETSSKKLRFS